MLDLQEESGGECSCHRGAGGRTRRQLEVEGVVEVGEGEGRGEGGAKGEHVLSAVFVPVPSPRLEGRGETRAHSL